MHKYLCLSLFILLLLQIPFLAIGDKKLIEHTCEITEYYDLCIATLTANDTSLDADLKGLTLILLDVVRDKGYKALEKIKSLNKTNPEWYEPLYECNFQYKAVVDDDVPEAIKGVNERRHELARDGMTDTTIKSQACEEGFMRRSLPLPLTELNTIVHNLAYLTINFVGLL